MVKVILLSSLLAKKRVKDSEWFKDKMLLAHAQEGVVLNDEQHNFLADILEETDDCKDLQLQATTNFKADHVDVYDSECDEDTTINAIFMVNLSPVGSLNDDMVEPHYDSGYTLSSLLDDIEVQKSLSIPLVIPPFDSEFEHLPHTLEMLTSFCNPFHEDMPTNLITTLHVTL
nr:hypothetical protein [Tanacetum cinerariifolium]